MCGIAGFWEKGETREPESAGRRMTASLAHRGPDDEGHWVERDLGLCLGHRRLSIIDISPLGRQPMVSPTGRYVIVYNGEVYNFRQLRRALELMGFVFRGGSDTEVLLAGFEAWGVKSACTRFVGMFALALWDRSSRILHLVRDRLGVKPLYYGWESGTFLFGSELKALRAHPAFREEVDRDALAAYMRYGYVPAPQSIYRGVRKLAPGSILSVASPSDRDAEPAPYWSAAEVVKRGSTCPYGGSDREAEEHLDVLLRDAVGSRMVADVPLGAFLSGGVDSSTVVAMMQAQSSRPVRTFSIGVKDKVYDEACNAKEVARHLGTDHNELYVTPREAMEVIPALPEIYDEPFADSSQIPTFLVSRMARSQVTVALSGDGGDELFAGYNRHVWAPRVWSFVERLPLQVRRVAAAALRATSPDRWNEILGVLEPSLPASLRHRAPGMKMHKMAEALLSRGPDEMYSFLVSQWREPSGVVSGSAGSNTVYSWPMPVPEGLLFTERMLYLDLVGYLPDDIMTKVDRASMAVSLEAREPLLDHRLVEFAWSLPRRLKLRDGQGKWILRQVLYRYVPRELVERPKAGFGVPIEAWLRGPLREWAEDLLDERRLRSEGFLNPAPVLRAWREHIAGRGALHHHLWTALMFEAWLRKQSPGAALQA